MDMSEKIISKPQVVALHQVLKRCGMVISVFFKPLVPLPCFPGRDFPINLIAELDDFQGALSELGALRLESVPASTLNRLEFEGSLVQVILDGGCHRQSTHSRSSAQSLVEAALDAIYPQFGGPVVFRLDDTAWSQLTVDATVSNTYLLWEGARGLWWFLCIADFD
jgi:hypothetical protein